MAATDSAGPAAMATAAPDLARRFLHVNLNAAYAQRTTGFYHTVGSLITHMATEEMESDGLLFGFPHPVRTRAHFLYDSRGPRAAPALEVAEWISPRSVGQPYNDATTPGIHALAVQTTQHNSAAPTQGTGQIAHVAEGILPVPGTILADPDGVEVEVYPARSGDSPMALGIRVHCTDLDTSLAWYRSIGFVGGGQRVALSLPRIDHDTTCPATGSVVAGEAVRIRLPEDDPPFTLCLFQPTAPPPTGSAYSTGNHLGLFRIALRVEDVTTTCRILSQRGVPTQGPITFGLPGTAVASLRIAFCTDPDGVVVELVERPSAHFRRDHGRRAATITDQT